MKWEAYREKAGRDEKFREGMEEFKLHFALGNAVLRRRLEKGWSQTELARRVGTKQANVSRIEAGLGNPTLELIKKLCDSLELEIDFVRADGKKPRRQTGEGGKREGENQAWFVRAVEPAQGCYSFETKLRGAEVEDRPIMVPNWPIKAGEGEADRAAEENGAERGGGDD